MGRACKGQDGGAHHALQCEVLQWFGGLWSSSLELDARPWVILALCMK